MGAAAYILQIALFGAAGTAFISAHLRNQAASRAGAEESPAQRWRLFRFSKVPKDDLARAALRRAAAIQTLWGALFLLAAFVVPLFFQAR